MTIREKARKARCAEGLWLASLLGLGLFVLPLAAHAKEKVLLLSVLKEGRPDPKLLRVAQDRLQKTGEQLVQSNDLSNTERKCMQQDCLLALAASKGADVVLADLRALPAWHAARFAGATARSGAPTAPPDR